MAGFEQFLFALWFIVPGYISILLFMIAMQIAIPAFKYKWSKIAKDDKIFFSILIGALFLSSFKYLPNFKDVPIPPDSLSKLSLFILISISSALFLVCFLYLFAFVVNYIVTPYISILGILIERKIFRKVTKERFIDQLLDQSNYFVGIIYNTILLSIIDAETQKTNVEFILKGGQKIKGKILFLKKDLSECIIETKTGVSVSFSLDEVQVFSHKEKPEEYKKTFVDDLISITWFLIGVSVLSMYWVKSLSLITFLLPLFLPTFYEWKKEVSN